MLRSLHPSWSKILDVGGLLTRPVRLIMHAEPGAIALRLIKEGLKWFVDRPVRLIMHAEPGAIALRLIKEGRFATADRTAGGRDSWQKMPSR